MTRVAREVGTEGKLGGQAEVPGVAGTWKDLTDNVNVMAANLTDQVRGIVKVVTAVANGDLRQKLTVEAKGEVAALADTINNMTDTLGDVRRAGDDVAREVGVEGRLGGQANVPGAAGTWKDLTDNVNLLAANLTTQVRAIAEVATAVTKGDLTRSIQVEARGEVAELKDNINAMIGNLRETTRAQHRAGLAEDQPRASSRRMLQGQRDLVHRRRRCCSPSSRRWSTRSRASSTSMDATTAQRRTCKLLAELRRRARAGRAAPLSRSAKAWSASAPCEQQRILLARRAAATRSDLRSGLGRGAAAQHHRAAGAVRRQVKAVIELASLHEFTASHLAFLEQLTGSPSASCSTPSRRRCAPRACCKQSQQLAGELQTQQNELQQTNEELAHEGAAARRAERRGRAQEPGGRAGPPRARREGRRARAHLEVQVRVPREHVARAAHAAQLAS